MPRAENEMGLSRQQYPGLTSDGKEVPSACGKDDGIPHALYSERLLVGYRWYNAHQAQVQAGAKAQQVQVTPAFAFGTGLSYASFVFSELHISTANATTGNAAASVSVSAVVANNGTKHSGREVAQLYMSFPASAGEPPKQLKGFVKTALLAPGEKASVSFSLSERDLSIWDTAKHGWAKQTGEFGVFVGSSSADIRLVDSFRI
eukprot:g1927.t1